MPASIQITESEYQHRSSRLLDYLKTNKLSGVVLFDNYYILYYSGFAFIPTERPITFVMNAHGEKVLFVPRLEVEHAKSSSYIERVDSYEEYPLDPHPMEILKKTLVDMGISGSCGVDTDGYPWIFGYRGPGLSELIGSNSLQIKSFIEDQMMVKSPEELALIRESIKWAHLAHTLLQRYTRVGKTETEVSWHASGEATMTMLDAIGPIYQSQNPFSSMIDVGYRGQIGRNAAIPHALANNITFQVGDVLVSGASAPMWGYNSELERTMVIGQANDKQKRFFDYMVAVQDVAFKAIKPGLPCSNIDRALRVYYEQHDLMPYWKHHVGHSIGLRYHEGPFLDLGDSTILAPGMVFTIEPGLYVPDLGGFRHSDTIVITEDGIDILTYYPRDLQSLTIPG